MNTKEIEEAVDILKRDGYWGENKNVKAFDLLLSVAQEYLAIKELPKEECLLDKPKVICSNIDEAVDYGYEKGHKDGFNQALHLCKLAMMKKEAEWKERIPSIEIYFMDNMRNKWKHTLPTEQK